MKKAKLAYLHSLLALLVCISLFVGTTFAWFTDSVSSVNNIIKSGNLDLEMYWTDNLTTGTWYNVEDPAHNTIFSYDNWEPGYTDVKYIKIVNKGSLAFKYQLAITPMGEVGKLAEVINVYYGTDGAVASRDDLSSLTSLGLLKSIMGGTATAQGTLLPEGQSNSGAATGEVIVTLAMSMLTTAGNEYQLQSAGDFTVTAMATQVENEFDSFGNDYDAGSEWPQVITSSKGEVAVTPVNGILENEVSINAGSVTATVPAGVAVEDGVEKLTLTTTPLEKSTSDVTPSNGEILVPLDVHIEGIADGNTTPIIIDLGAILPKYLNMGTYSLYHVENGVTETMNLVASKADLVNHNDYTYDSATGEVSVALASFSEICILQPGDNTYNVWMGGVDFSWYDPDATSFTIYNADQLNGLAYIVSGQAYAGFDGTQDSFENKIVTLARDIDLNGNAEVNDLETGKPIVWYPIGLRKHGEGANAAGETLWYDWGGWFEGTFDGNGHTVKNISQNTWAMDGNYDAGYYKRGMGLFAGIRNGTVQNLTVENFQSDGEFTPTGCVAAYAEGNSTFENIRITGCNPRVYNTGNGGLVGWDNGGDTEAEASHFTFKNITVDSTNKISALWGSWDVGCGGILGSLGEYSYADFKNCNVSATIDVYNDVCANYQYFWYRYAGMFIGIVNNDKNGAIVLDRITAENCKANFGNRHEYFYCEFVKNSLASYTHDYQFSRVTHDELNWSDTNGNGELDTEDISKQTITCKHDHDAQGEETINGQVIAVEDWRAVYLPFRQLFGGYGWGTRGVQLSEYPDIKIAIEGSEKKFELDKQKLIDAGVLDDNLTDEEYRDSIFTLAYAEDGDYVEIRLGDYFKTLGNVTDNDINVDGVFASATAIAHINNQGEVIAYGDQIDKLRVRSEFKKSDTGDWRDGVLKIYYDLNNTGINALIAISIQDYANCEPTVVRALIQESRDNDVDIGGTGWADIFGF